MIFNKNVLGDYKRLERKSAGVELKAITEHGKPPQQTKTRLGVQLKVYSGRFN